MFENTYERGKGMIQYHTNCRLQRINEITLKSDVNSPNSVC